MNFDREKVAFNLAILRTHGEKFEIAVDPDLAIEFKTNKTLDIHNIIKSEHIFSDVKKGQLASEEEMEKVFNTVDPIEVAKIILEKGEIQLSAEHRDKERKKKRNQIIEMIKINAIDPKTKLPIPLTRLENAFEEAKIKIDDHKTTEEQLQEIMKKLMPVLPIKLDRKKVAVKIPANYAAKSYGIIKEFGKIMQEAWQNDGSLIIEIELPAGLQNDFLDKMNSLTHGEAETKIID